MIKIRKVNEYIEERKFDELTQYIESTDLPDFKKIETRKGMKALKSMLVKDIKLILKHRVEHKLSITQRVITKHGLTGIGAGIGIGYTSSNEHLYKRIREIIYSYIDIQTEGLSGIKDIEKKRVDKAKGDKSGSSRKQKGEIRNSRILELIEQKKTLSSLDEIVDFLLKEWDDDYILGKTPPPTDKRLKNIISEMTSQKKKQTK